jgi:hypothetical protein
MSPALTTFLGTVLETTLTAGQTFLKDQAKATIASLEEHGPSLLTELNALESQGIDWLTAQIDLAIPNQGIIQKITHGELQKLNRDVMGAIKSTLPQKNTQLWDFGIGKLKAMPWLAA